MMHRLTMFLLAFLPLLSLATKWGVQKTDKFETLGDGVIIGNPSEVNSEGGIIYNSFGSSTTLPPNIPQLSGVRAHSPTHYILAQRPARGSFATTGLCLKLKKLYFGCTTANIQGTVNIPFKCLLTLTSFDGDGNLNGEQKVTFKPNNKVMSDMVKVTSSLPPARVVQANATILRSEGDVLGPVGTFISAMLVDDVSYIQYDDDAAGKHACGKGF